MTPAGQRRWPWLLALLLAAIAVVRVLAADNDLWLDEIWTLEQIRSLHSALGVFTELQQENHALYTLWAYLCGPEVSGGLYRLPAVGSGLITVAVAGWIAVRQSGARVAAPFAVGLVGFSYLSVHFGSEARGYAPSTALALLAFAALLHGIDRPQRRWRVLFGTALCLALVAQPIAIDLLAAAAVWIPVHRLRRAVGVRRALVESAGWLALPVAFFAANYLVYLRHLQTGGGAEHTLAEVGGNAIAYTFGLPVALGSAGLIALGAVVVLAGLATLVRERDDLCVFYLAGGVAAPLALLWLRGSALIYERYFVLSATLVLLSTSHLLTRLWQRAPRPLAALLLAAFVTGSGSQALPLLRYGRGDVSGLLRRVAAATATAEIRYSANHPFRVPMVIDHHAPRALPGRTLRYVGPNDRPDWVIKSLLDPGTDLDRAVTSPDGETFRLVLVVPSAPLSGFWWAAYRREG